eukprot:XP_011675602.1 PREDICTED: uncharacterized protein LOC577311 [Strongylocentrotus purpuratus]
MSDYYKYLEAKQCERRYSTIQYICDTVQLATVLDNKPPSSSDSAGESSSLREGSIDFKALKMRSPMELTNGFMWKQLAHGIDRAFGTILSACMLGCGIYAVVSFSQAPKG